MGELSRFDIVLLLVAAWVAVTSLVKLMTARRERLVNEVRRQLVAERERQKEQQEQQKEERKAA